VYGAEQLRWQEEKNQEEHARKQGDSSAIGSLGEGTPGYYIRRFLDNTKNEIAKCLKIIFNSTVCLLSAYPSSSLTSDLSSRVCEATRLNGIVIPNMCIHLIS
jgi:hypothetical protein